MSGIFHQQIKSLDELMPYGPYPMYPSGILDEGKPIYRYAHESSEHPILTLAEPIYDSERNVIPTGYYELVLSDDRQFLILSQIGKIIAILPVFRLEEDKEEVAKMYDKKYLKQQVKEQQTQAKIDAKSAKRGIPPKEKDIYMQASIEYKKDGQYYLIKYERGRIRAWAAIKG